MTDAAPPPASREAARSAKAEVAELLAATSGVAGVGLERLPDGGWSVRVNVTTVEVAQALGEQVPTGPDAVPVRIRVTGPIEPATGGVAEAGGAEDTE
ncbi:hypothetical protein [Ruania albidiflava]|uniref:hypothetical protein n=1 Tax=Ruania albidiflava TaxID=366586 RepID=UPI0003B4D771|nr:hypothetical protein [Ruania albidiflava]